MELFSQLLKRIDGFVHACALFASGMSVIILDDDQNRPC